MEKRYKIKETYRKHIVYLCILTMLFACSKPTKNIPDTFDYGTTEQGFYKNDYFNMEVTFNPDWVIQDEQQVNNLTKQGTDLFAGENNDLKSFIKASQINTANLLVVFKHELGASVAYNPSFMIIAENTKNFPGIKTGEDYFFHAKKLLKQTNIPYSFDKEILEQTIGNTTFHTMEATIEYMGETIVQEYITTIKNGFSLSFIISYTTEENKKELYEIINTIKI